MGKGTWLGFVFFIAIVVLVFSTLVIGRITVFKKTYQIKILFDNLGGVKKGDDVRVDGIVVGKVSDFEFATRGVIAYIDLDEDITVYSDYQIVSEQYSMLGGNIISISRGTKTNERIDPKVILLQGRVKPSSLDELGNFAAENKQAFQELINSLRDVAKDIKEGSGTIGKLIKDPELYNQIKEIVSKIKSGEGTVGKLITSDELYKDVTDLLNQVKHGKGFITKILYDENFAQEITNTIDTVNKLVKKVEAGEGTLGKLTQDDELYKKAKQTLEGTSSIFGKVAATKVSLGSEYRTFSDNYGIGKVFLRIEPSEDKYFLAGVSILDLDKHSNIDFKDKISEYDSQTIIKPDVQLAYRIPWILDKRLTGRFGLLEGKVGGGVELNWDDFYLFKHPFQLTVEGRDAYNSVEDEDIDENINGPMIRAFAKTQLAREGFFKNFKLFAGGARGKDHPELMAGIGFEYEEEDIRTLVSLLGLSR